MELISANRSAIMEEEDERESSGSGQDLWIILFAAIASNLNVNTHQTNSDYRIIHCVISKVYRFYIIPKSFALFVPFQVIIYLFICY